MNTTARTKSELGFTLMETMVVVAVFAVIMAGLLTLYTNFIKIYNSQQATARVLGAATLAGNELQSDANQASEIVASHTFAGTVYTTDSDTLVLKMPAIDGSGNIITDTYDYTVFYIVNGRLIKRVDAHANSDRQTLVKQLSDTVSTVSFVYNSADLAAASKIEVDILMSVTVGHATMSHRLLQDLFLRNLSI